MTNSHSQRLHVALHRIDPSHPYCAVGLSNPKTPANVGAVMRSCVCFNANEVLYTGTRYDRAQRFCTDTTNSTVPLTHIKSFSELDHHETGPHALTIVAVELVENATPLPDFVHPQHALYLFGPEDYSLSQDTINSVDEVVFIPADRCLNLSAAVNIVLYDRCVKSNTATSSAEYNSLIINSRDCRNNLQKKLAYKPTTAIAGKKGLKQQ